MKRAAAPSFAAVDDALVNYAVSVAAMHESGGKDLPRATMERVATLGFVFEQLRRDCKDLAGRIQEFARVQKPVK